MWLTFCFAETLILTSCLALSDNKCFLTSCLYNGQTKWSLPKGGVNGCSEITFGGHSFSCPNKDTAVLLNTPYVTPATKIPFKENSTGTPKGTPKGTPMVDSTTCERSGETRVNYNCSERCLCYGKQWVCNSTFECSSNATCTISDGVGQCLCKTGFHGDGETCLPYHKDCQDAYEAGHRQDGVYTVVPSNWSGHPFNVSCDMKGNDGGWTIFQRRIDGTVDFYRNWTSYKHGFGFLDDGKEFWLGNDKLFHLTNQGDYKLRVEISTGANALYAEYEAFRIGDEDSQYTLSSSEKKRGNAGDGLLYSSGRSFSTYDRDNDNCGIFHYAVEHYGAWWYTNKWCKSCQNTEEFCDDFVTNSSCHNVCAKSNLNSGYSAENDYGKNMNWDFSHNCYLSASKMKIKRSF